MRRKTLLKRAICCMLIAVISLVLLPATAHAETYTHVYKSAGTMPEGELVKTKPRTSSYNSKEYKTTYTYYCYKITIPANGFIKLSCTSSFEGWVYILPALSKCSSSKYPDGNAVEEEYFSEGARTRYVSLNKGTYYLCAPGIKSGKIKYSFTKSYDLNYCKAKASKLEANTTKKICYNIGYEHARWFRINLATKKKITVILKPLDNKFDGSYFTIYDSKGKTVSCPLLDGNTYQSVSKPKGTYYLKVCRAEDSSGDSSSLSRIYTLKWK